MLNHPHTLHPSTIVPLIDIQHEDMHVPTMKDYSQAYKPLKVYSLPVTW